MKIIIVIAAVIALVWLWGGRTMHYRAEAVIAAPPEWVFRHLTEPALLRKWIGGFVESKPLGDGVLRVGARSVEVVEENGRRLEMQSEVLRLEAPRVLEVGMQGGFAAMVNAYRLEPVDSRTRLTMTMQASYTGAMRLLAPFIGRSVQRKLEGDFAQLAKLADGPP